MKPYKQTYKYRAYCNVGTRRRFIKLATGPLAEVWNSDVRQRKEIYEASQQDESIKPVNSYKDPRSYGLIRGKEKYPGIHKWVLQDVLVKVDSSYKSFFDLCKKDPAARPPGEKFIHRCLTFRVDSRGKFGGAEWNGKCLYCKGLGRFKVVLHRPVGGKIKTVSVNLNRGKFYVTFSCELPAVPEIDKKNPVAVRLEFKDHLFIKDSTGQTIDHPEFYFTELDRLRRLSRSLSRKKAGSKNRRKAKYTLQKWHTHIANKRKYFLEKIANDYVSRFDLIEVPKLPLKQKIMQATTSRKAMSLCDAAYGLFIQILKHSAKKNGKTVIEYAL